MTHVNNKILEMHKEHIPMEKNNLKNDATLLPESEEAIESSSGENPSKATSKQGKLEHFICSETSR